MFESTFIKKECANSEGDLTAFSQGAKFGATQNGVSIIRYVNSVGIEKFVPQSGSPSIEINRFEAFPDGYPKYNNEIGNPMSIGAYELYLKELGYSSASQSGNKVGIKIIVDGYNLTEGNDEKVNKKIEQKKKNKKQNKDNIDKTNIPLVELESWGSEIQKTIKDYLIYPPKAISRKQTGQVILSVSLSGRGQIINAKIEK